MWNKFKDIISQYLEINETRKSIIVLTLIGLVIIGLYKAYLGNDMPPNISNLVLGLSGIIFGQNIGNAVSNMYGNYIASKINETIVGNDNNQNINVDNVSSVNVEPTNMNNSPVWKGENLWILNL